MKIGTQVRLNSGSPDMWIIGWNNKFIYTAWLGDRGEIYEGVYIEECLTFIEEL